MRLLLDTHVLLWCLGGDERLPEKAVQLIQDAAQVFVSVTSLWEMAIKEALGKLKLDINFDRLAGVIQESGYTILPITAQHTVPLLTLPPLHRDPFDRMLVSQCIAEPLYLLTCDAEVSQYGDHVIFVKSKN